MTSRILLVTGSRALVGSEFEADAKAIVSALVGSLPDGATVVTGDAGGPDEWALEAASSTLLSLRTRMWALDGWIYDEHKARAVEWAEHIPAEKRSGPTWPLVRNAAMARSVAAKALGGAVARVLALEAEWSTTHGTAHTLGKARAAGLTITHITFERSKGR